MTAGTEVWTYLVSLSPGQRCVRRLCQGEDVRLLGAHLLTSVREQGVLPADTSEVSADGGQERSEERRH